MSVHGDAMPRLGEQVGFGDVQVPGPLAPLVRAAQGAATEGSERVATVVDLTYIAPPPGSPVPLAICADRAPPVSTLLLLLE